MRESNLTTIGRRARRSARRLAIHFARPTRRLISNPFEDTRALLVHVCHHKVGTVWFKRILTAVANEFGLRFFSEMRPTRISKRAEMAFFRHSRDFERFELANFRGTHMVRDPRDVVVSAYYYHLWTRESWVHEPQDAFNGLSYQQYLLSLDVSEGLAAEIRRSAKGTLAEMASWDFHRPEFLELRYEDLIAHELEHLTKVFQHYGFNQNAVNRSVAIAQKFSFSAVTGRSLGEVATGTHLRSGRPGAWREILTPSHIALLRDLTGDVVGRLGYDA